MTELFLFCCGFIPGLFLGYGIKVLMNRARIARVKRDVDRIMAERYRASTKPDLRVIHYED